MIEKRFRVQEHCLRSSYGIEAENWLVTNDNHSVVLNDKAEAHMVANMGNDVIDKLNALHEENEYYKIMHEQFKKDNLALAKENRQKEIEMKRLYHYFKEYLEDTIPPEAFTKLWHKIKNNGTFYGDNDGC